MAFAFASPEVRAASSRFRAFFQELGRVFVEREDVLAQIALALLGREHVLMTGPPGTAKSGIATAVLGRIVDENTGQPSLFARQFTESTVQTDLVGPIDFKTLMQTGRTEHFTDEGMLGAVHSFLDEVLDGRDMLLRATLNVLHERELKQGSKTTQGRIECALMTTNRYLAEVLESSRETLLAFVDRVAFVGFVPKSFADPASLGRVLRSQVGGTRRLLESSLTIQDLDVLQGAVDNVVLHDDICTALCTLLDHFDADLAAAAKNDPTFVPTRYLSTRTAVRLGRTLRAICVYDAIMTDTPRVLEVDMRDFGMLRLSLLLSGPAFETIGRLLEKESDPRERRQLSILRTEREIFERALARLPKPAKRAPAIPASNVQALTKELNDALPVRDPKQLVEAAAKLVSAADAGTNSAADASTLLATTLARLNERALRAATTAGAGPDGHTGDAITELSTLADGLEKASGATRPIARWLRGRAIQLHLDSAVLASAKLGDLLDAELSAAPTLAEIAGKCEAVIGRLRGVLDSCAKLRAAGAEPPQQGAFDAAIAITTSRVEDELVELLDAGFRRAVTSALKTAGHDELGAVLRALAPALETIDAHGASLTALGAKPGSLKARVVGPRVEPLVVAAFERVEGRDRLELVAEVGALVLQLEKSGLKAVIPPARLLRLAARALVRCERGRGAPPKSTVDHAGYRALRGVEQRVSLSYAIVELALRVGPALPSSTESPADLKTALGTLVGELPADLRAQIVDLDLARIERAVDFVVTWWKSLGAKAESARESANAAQIGDAIAKLAKSRFFHVTHDEGALLRFALESRVVGDVFPEAAKRATDIRAKIDALEAESSHALNALRRGRADAGWAEILGHPASSTHAR